MWRGLSSTSPSTSASTKARLALLEEGGEALARVGSLEELQAERRLAVERTFERVPAGLVEQALRPRDGQRGESGNAFDQAACLRLDVLREHVDEPEPEGLLRSHQVPGEHEPPRGARQKQGEPVRDREAERDLGAAE